MEKLIETYTLTEEDINNAASYVPTITKMAFIKATAERCYDTLGITSSSGGDSDNPLPNCYKINTDKQSRYLMGAFVMMYLGKAFEPEDENDPWLMSIPEYDFYAGGHIFEQLNRMKNNAEVRNKCFDMMADYSELKYRFNSDVKGILNALNDSASRLLSYMEMASTPEQIKKTMEQMKDNQAVLDEYLEHREENLQKALEAPED